MIIKQLDLNCQEEADNWDALARSQGMLYHVSLWARVLQQTYNFLPVYLYVEDNGKIVSLLPLFHVRKPLVKGELVSIPHVEAGGLVGLKSYSLYLKHIFKHLRVREIRIAQFLNPLGKLPANTRQVVMIKDLPASMDSLLPSIKAAKERSQMRNVLKRSYTIDIGNDRNLFTDLYRLYLEKMRELGTPPHGPRFLQATIEAFSDMCRIVVVRDSEKTLGAGMVLFDEGKAMNLLYLTVPKRYLRLNIGSLINYHAMAFGIEKQIPTYIIGRCEVNSGNYKYKTHLGGKALPLYLYKFVRTSEGYAAFEGKTTKEKYRIFSRVWSCLPVAITDHFGPFVRKWLY